MADTVGTTGGTGGGADAPEGWDWRVLLVLLVLVGVAWWIWTKKTQKPEVPLTPNITSPPPAPPGISKSLVEKMAMATDKQIPVVMTSGTPVPYDTDEIHRIVNTVLGKVNAMNESLTFISLASASKTQDSYKTVSYDIVANVYDSKNNVGIMVTINVLIPVSGFMYVRTLQLFHAHGKEDGLRAASEPVRMAAYESPLDVLAGTELK